MRKMTLILAVLMFVMATSAIFAQNNIAVSTFDIGGGAVSTEEAEAITELFIAELVSTGKVTVVDRANFDKTIKEMKFQASDWSNKEKTVTLGNAINATMVARGQILKLGSRMYLTSTIIDLKTAVVLSSAKEQFVSVDDIFDLLPTYTKELAKSINSGGAKTNEIGNIGPGGGIIFYYSEDGFDVYEPDGSTKKCHYLEVSKFDLGEIRWCTNKNNNTTYCCDIATLTSLGCGKINTFKIIKSYHSGGTITKENCAALACYLYSTATTKAGDWFLPSKDELNLLYKNLGEKVLISNTTNNNWYWSSSQDYDDDSAWYQRFDYGYQTDYTKDSTNSVRAVRAF